ncbi:MAG TPA: hypothetical protein VK457_10975, partial [Chloroflexota bacterium]|nr:hypothetical protein [Chloroflexota bacterium]
MRNFLVVEVRLRRIQAAGQRRAHQRVVERLVQLADAEAGGRGNRRYVNFDRPCLSETAVAGQPAA